MLDRISEVGDHFGLNINTSKTIILVISRTQQPPVSVKIYGRDIEVVENFRYLGTWLNRGLDSDTEVRARIEQARATFNSMKQILTNRNISLHLRYRFVICFVYSVLLYGSESWTLKVTTMNRLEAFEMWILRRLLKIPWTAHVTNEEVLRRAQCERELLQMVKRRKTAYLGHVMRNDKYDLLKLIMEGRRGIGRRKYCWLKNIRDWTGLDANSLFPAAKDREGFAEIVSNLR